MSKRISRKEFVSGYARRSVLNEMWASSGFVCVDGDVLIALPCGCGEEDCQGWAMVSGSEVLRHLDLNAPEPLRTAYRNAVSKGSD